MDPRSLLTLGIYLNSALYLGMIFVAGMKTGNDIAWKLATASAGLCYLAYTIQVVFPDHRHIASTAVAGSVVAGLLGGLALLWKS